VRRDVLPSSQSPQGAAPQRQGPGCALCAGGSIRHHGCCVVVLEQLRPSGMVPGRSDSSTLQGLHEQTLLTHVLRLDFFFRDKWVLTVSGAVRG